MYRENGMPATVERLLRDHVPSVASVELLLALREAGSRPQDVGEVAATIGCSQAWAGRELERLRRRGLARGDEAGGWIFFASSKDLAAAAQDLAGLWYTDRRTVTRRLFAMRSRGRAARS